MARGNDRGKDFDQQFNENERKGRKAEQARLDRMYHTRSSNKQSEGCADKGFAILVLLGALGYGAAEGVSRIL